MAVPDASVCACGPFCLCWVWARGGRRPDILSKASRSFSHSLALPVDDVTAMCGCSTLTFTIGDIMGLVQVKIFLVMPLGGVFFHAVIIFAVESLNSVSLSMNPFSPDAWGQLVGRYTYARFVSTGETKTSFLPEFRSMVCRHKYPSCQGE